jgi:RNA polymerase sigma factor (sigma-70 family)
MPITQSADDRDTWPASETLATRVLRDHFGYLRALCRRRARSREDADDLCQEVLARLLSVPAGPVRNVMAVVYRCVANVAVDYYRKQRLHVGLDETDAEQVPYLREDIIPAVEFGEDVLRTLRKMPAGIPRDVYIKRLLDGAPFSEIASNLNITVQSAYTYYSKVNQEVWKALNGKDG